MTLTEGTNITATGLDANSVSLYGRMITLDTDKCVYVYQDTAVNGYVRARVVTTSGATISAIGSETVVSQLMGNSAFQVAPMSTSGFVVVGRDANTTVGRIIGVACSVTGSTITAGTDTSIEGAAGTVNVRSEFNVGQVRTNKAIVTYLDRNNSFFGTARAFTVSGTTINTPGSAHVFSSTTTTYHSVDGFNMQGTVCCATYLSAGDVTAKVLSVTGTTVTSSGAELTIVSANTYIDTMTRGMTDTEVFICYEQTNGVADTGHLHYLTRSGSTLTQVTSQGYGTSGTGTIIHGITRMNDTVSLITYLSNNTEDVREMYLNAGVLTIGDTLIVDSPSANNNVGIALVGGQRAASIHNTTDIAIITSDLVSVAAGDGLDIAPMRKPADIDADGSNIYLAALNDLGFPILIKIAATLDADGSTVFDPAEGSDIGVQAGNFDANVIWIAGAFDGTNTVEKTEDGGSTFTVKDPATLGGVTAFTVGPDSDDKILAIDDNEDIHETINDGDDWTTHNTGVGVATNAVVRLDTNVQEVIFGNEANALQNVNYSINSGVDLESLSSGIDFPNVDVSGVAIG